MNVEIYKQQVRTKLFNNAASNLEVEIDETKEQIKNLKEEKEMVEERIKKAEIKLEVCKEVRKTMKF